MRRRLLISAWGFLSPFLLVSGVFFIYPFLWATILAFYQTSGSLHSEFVGWSNFRFVLTDPEFFRALRNTTVFAIFSIFLQLPLSLGLALLLNSRRDRWKGIFRLILFSPHLVGPIFVGILFSVLFTARYGMINRFLQSVSGWGLELRWLGDPSLVMPALILTSLWMYVGFNMVYFLAGLQSVSDELMDAARVDGAGPWQRFRHVIVPAIKPVALFVVVMSTVGSFQLFELPYALLEGTGGPDNAGLTIVMYLYQHAFESGDLGTGAAVGWILTLIIFSISIVQIRLSGGLQSS
ncbi:MAG: sugar ABC transporter permease [Oceanipulchritudo sp.]